MPETETKFEGYQEDENHVPDPTAQYGTLDTSGTAGAAHAKLEEVSPVFEVARRESLKQAGRAVDPDDDSTPISTVILPDEDRNRDEVVKNLKEQAKKVDDEEKAFAATRRGPAERAAAEESETSSTSDQSNKGDDDSKSSDSKKSSKKS